MVMIPNPPKFFAETSLRHVLWQITLIDQLLTVTGRILGEALSTQAKQKAREQINLLLDKRLEHMRVRDGMQAKGARP